MFVKVTKTRWVNDQSIAVIDYTGEDSSGIRAYSITLNNGKQIKTTEEYVSGLIFGASVENKIVQLKPVSVDTSLPASRDLMNIFNSLPDKYQILKSFRPNNNASLMIEAGIMVEKRIMDGTIKYVYPPNTIIQFEYTSMDNRDFFSPITSGDQMAPRNITTPDIYTKN